MNTYPRSITHTHTVAAAAFAACCLLLLLDDDACSLLLLDAAAEAAAALQRATGPNFVTAAAAQPLAPCCACFMDVAYIHTLTALVELQSSSILDVAHSLRRPAQASSNCHPTLDAATGQHSMVRISIPHYGTTEQAADVPRVSRKNSVSAPPSASSACLLVLAL